MEGQEERDGLEGEEGEGILAHFRAGSQAFFLMFWLSGPVDVIGFCSRESFSRTNGKERERVVWHCECGSHLG